MLQATTDWYNTTFFSHQGRITQRLVFRSSQFFNSFHDHMLLAFMYKFVKNYKSSLTTMSSLAIFIIIDGTALTVQSSWIFNKDMSCIWLYSASFRNTQIKDEGPRLFTRSKIGMFSYHGHVRLTFTIASCQISNFVRFRLFGYQVQVSEKMETNVKALSC